MYAELAQTLLQLIEAATPRHEGLLVTDAEIELPLEVTTAQEGERLLFLARPPHSRWEGGFLPPLHRARLAIGLEER
jgi:hypothetical protein